MVEVHTMSDVGAVVRRARRAQTMTQADLARAVGVSRDWVVRLEKGHPRLEAQLVLDALDALGMVTTLSLGSPATESVGVSVASPADDLGDAFQGLVDRLPDRPGRSSDG
jgi:transcriptional regulator with XRE-family HTH domain